MIQVQNRVLAPKNSTQKPIVYDVYYHENELAKPIVIFCHGYKGFKDWGAWNLVAEDFARAGFFFLKFNFSHNGGTIEQPIDFPDLEAFAQNNYSIELEDLGRVIDFISNDQAFKDQINGANIHIIGHSRGGGIVLIKGQEDARITTVTTWAGVSDYKIRFKEGTPGFNKFKKEGRLYVENGRTKQQMPHDWQFYTNFIEHEERLTIRRAANNLNKPCLIVHGDNDSSVLLEEAKNVHQWNPTSELCIIPEANHVFGASHPFKKSKMPAHLNQVVTKTIRFLNNSR